MNEDDHPIDFDDENFKVPEDFTQICCKHDRKSTNSDEIDRCKGSLLDCSRRMEIDNNENDCTINHVNNVDGRGNNCVVDDPYPESNDDVVKEFKNSTSVSEQIYYLFVIYH